ncbi:hypothetical protein FSP39_010129 [Pinctada imbricata]|uniref:Uncharacterized protein n=1 Tax=Pinctada imbricata TaxID=66713 RepID=A0AA88YDK7_PINIB|nr:hypothetical protein FSP39_010129 [Pinctada imbricata]
MFFGKIQGRSQQTPKNQLVTLYKEGYTCFLRCSSFRNDLEAIICQPNIGFLLPFDNGRIKVKTDLNLISDLSSNCSFSLEIHDLQRTVSLLHNFEGKYGSLAERSGTKVFLKFNIQYLLLCSLPSWFPDPRSSVNQGIYKSLSDVLNALKQSRFDATTHSILSAVLLYRIGMYRRVVDLGIKIKSRLKQTNVMYEWGLRDRKYIHEGGEIHPFDAMMKKVVSMPFRLAEGTCIQELLLEERSSSWGVFCPPMAIISLLLYLSFHKLSSYTEADSVLRDLAMAINNTDTHHIPCFLRAISWEILGICQETGGYLHDAVHSYQRALIEPIHN